MPSWRTACTPTVWRCCANCCRTVALSDRVFVHRRHRRAATALGVFGVNAAMVAVVPLLTAVCVGMPGSGQEFTSRRRLALRGEADAERARWRRADRTGPARQAP